MAGKPVATIGSMHVCPMVTGYIPHVGGPVSGPGMPGVTVGPNTPTPDAVMPLKKIPFPKISLLDIVGAAVKGKGKDLKQARKNQEAIKKAAEEQEPRPAIFNVRWLKEDKVTRDGRVKKAVRVSADVTDIADGESITFSIERKNPLTEELEKIEIEATVEEGKAVGEWEINDRTERNHE